MVNLKNFLKPSDLEELERISTGSLVFDFILEGGIPRGKVVEFWGKESSGKSTFALLTAKNAIESGIDCLYIDLEDSLTKEYLDRLGIQNLYIWKNPTTKEIISEILGLNKSEPLVGKIGMIIIDSIAAFKDDDNPHYGAAKLISFFLSHFIELNRKLPAKQKTTLLITNQVRATISNFKGPSETSSGGYALKHYTHLRVRFDKSKIDQTKGTVVINISLPKSKTSIPYSTASILFDYVNSKIVVGEELFTMLNLFDFCEKENGVFKLKLPQEISEQLGDIKEFKQEARFIKFLESKKDVLEPFIRETMAKYFQEVR